MQLLSKIWNNFKVQPDIWFFCGFLITFSFSIRKVLYFFPISEQFNEYAGVYLYFSDIFLLLAIVSWGISIIYNKRFESSIYKANKVYIVAPFLLVLWAFMSISWSENQLIALFRSIKLLELFLLYLFIALRLRSYFMDISENVPPQKQINCSIWNNLLLRGRRGTIYGASVEQSTGQAWNILFKIIISVAIIQSAIAILQFILQHSLGIFWLKESLISPEILGVAKIIINNEVFIRSYGLFPHPNILGGFLAFSILITLLYSKMFHSRSKENVPPQKQRDCSTPVELFHVEQFTGQAWNNLILAVQVLALFLTFSKSAIIGLMLGLVYLYIKNVPSQYKCSTWNIIRDKCGTFLGFFKRYLKIAILGLLAIIVFLLIIKPDFYSLFIKSLDERTIYIDCSTPIQLFHMEQFTGQAWNIASLLFFGYGEGQFVLNMQSYSKQILEFWQFQPVHNVFLLIWSELGLVGLVLFLYLIFKLILKKTNAYLKAIFIGFLFIMLFDHYLWDIQQGQAMLWMVMGLMVASGVSIDKK